MVVFVGCDKAQLTARRRQDRLEVQLGKLTARVSGVEHQLVGIRGGVAGIHGGIAGMQARQDRCDDSLQRIEKRLVLLPQ